MSPSLFPTILPRPAEGADVAYTPGSVARALVETVRPEIVGASVWEPYAGGGAFVDALQAAGAGHIFATDCDCAAEGLNRGDVNVVCDVGRGWPWTTARPDWIVTNPPFSVLFGDEAGANGHLRVLFDTARVGVALLLVGQSLAPRKRDWLWDSATPDWFLWIRERIAFEGPGREDGGTDAREYAWIVWRRQADGGWNGRGLMGRVSTETGRVWLP
jgi:hypothetical protein